MGPAIGKAPASSRAGAPGPPLGPAHRFRVWDAEWQGREATSGTQRSGCHQNALLSFSPSTSFLFPRRPHFHPTEHPSYFPPLPQPLSLCSLPRGCVLHQLPLPRHLCNRVGLRSQGLMTFPMTSFGVKVPRCESWIFPLLVFDYGQVSPVPRVPIPTS